MAATQGPASFSCLPSQRSQTCLCFVTGQSPASRANPYQDSGTSGPVSYGLATRGSGTDSIHRPPSSPKDLSTASAISVGPLPGPGRNCCRWLPVLYLMTTALSFKFPPPGFPFAVPFITSIDKQLRSSAVETRGSASGLAYDRIAYRCASYRRLQWGKWNPPILHTTCCHKTRGSRHARGKWIVQLSCHLSLYHESARQGN